MADLTLTINGKAYSVSVDEQTPLLWVIRDVVGLKGTKFGCGLGLCGACTVHLNDQPIRSCQMPVNLIHEGQKITTIEGLSKTGDHPVQKAWVEHQVPQCGYCQSGQIMSAVALLKENPAPTDANIDAAMGGNICRCGTYGRIRQAIHAAASAVHQAKKAATPAPAKKQGSLH
ncbi:(2Fe-2S)-binding protein [Spirosoma radiotolerans]|uniref:(2Fe-2S)-binding protein n=1 Tax=Spirosoma radiotolerans TaxID=1379870 RepID=A0A0E3ZV29_9BACT|nr:(2Fe-2S)-binding protein [Spirosoma radiotolerans]AKD54884.1 (2Fe-2S)-binding protein [Spirosoma radiotolerans]